MKQSFIVKGIHLTFFVPKKQNESRKGKRLLLNKNAKKDGKMFFIKLIWFKRNTTLQNLTFSLESRKKINVNFETHVISTFSNTWKHSALQSVQFCMDVGLHVVNIVVLYSAICYDSCKHTAHVWHTRHIFAWHFSALFSIELQPRIQLASGANAGYFVEFQSDNW